MIEITDVEWRIKQEKGLYKSRIKEAELVKNRIEKLEKMLECMKKGKMYWVYPSSIDDSSSSSQET